MTDADFSNIVNIIGKAYRTPRESRRDNMIMMTVTCNPRSPAKSSEVTVISQEALFVVRKRTVHQMNSVENGMPAHSYL